MKIWRGKSSAPSLLSPSLEDGETKEGKEGDVMEDKREDSRIKDLLLHVKQLTELLIHMRDDVVFGNTKHVEKINDVLEKKYVTKGEPQ